METSKKRGVRQNPNSLPKLIVLPTTLVVFSSLPITLRSCGQRNQKIMYKLKKLSEEEIESRKPSFKLIKIRDIDDDWRSKEYWQCQKCNILYSPDDEILFNGEEYKCPKCKTNLYHGDKEYFEKEYKLTKIDE